MVLVREVKSLGAVARASAKPSIDMVYFSEQSEKNYDVLNNRNME